MSASSYMARMAFSPDPYPEKIAKGDSLSWYRLNTSYVNETMPLYEAAARIAEAHPFTTWQKTRGAARSNGNFKAGGYMAADIDQGNLSLEDVLALPLVARFGGYVYGTPSWTEADKRWRVVFWFDGLEFSPASYAYYTKALCWAMDGLSDVQVTDLSRNFWGKGLAAPSHFRPIVFPLGETPDPVTVAVKPKVAAATAVSVRHLAEMYLGTMKVEREAEQERLKRDAGDSSEIRSVNRLVEWWLNKVRGAGGSAANRMLNNAAWALSDLVLDKGYSGDELARQLLNAAVQREIPKAEAQAVIKSAMRKKGAWAGTWA